MSYLVYIKEALGNLFKPPVTSRYPLEPRKPVAGDRGRVVNDISRCILCGMCQRSCPTEAITVDRKAGTWTINPFACVQCKNCVDNCPVKSLSMAAEYASPGTKKSEIILTVKKEEGKKETSRKVEALHPSAMAKALDDRSHVVNNMLKCVFCGMCMRNCPAGAITVDRRTRMWRINLEACINCGTCIDNCPRKCLSLGCYLGNKTEVTLYGPAPRRPQRRPAAKPAAAAPAPASPDAGGSPAFQGAVSRVRPAGREELEAGKPAPESTAQTAAPAPEISRTQPPKAAGPAASVPQSDNPTHVRNAIDKCLFCGKCAHTCPVGAITLDRRARTWTIDREKCITCGACVAGCPAHSLTMEDDWAEGESHALVCTLQGKPPVRRPRPGAAKPGPVKAAPPEQGKAATTKEAAPPPEADKKPEAATPAPAISKAAPPETVETAAPAASVPQSDNPTHVRNDIDKCLFCGKCAHTCPAGAITLDRRARTWTIDREKCITCGACVAGCPAHSLTMEDDWAEGESHALVCTLQGKPPVRRPRPAPAK